jgi:hypothetical protein
MPVQVCVTVSDAIAPVLLEAAAIQPDDTGQVWSQERGTRLNHAKRLLRMYILSVVRAYRLQNANDDNSEISIA